MSSHYSFRYDFYSVGQGLFTAGYIESSDGKRRVRWVYDCGTSSSGTLIEQAIEKFGEDYFRDDASVKKLDLLVLSHFDTDHISGVVELLQNFKVDLLLLPYIPLWQRLVIAFAQGADTKEDLIEFFLDPALYLAGRSDSDSIRIVFVPPSNSEGPTGEGVVNNNPENNELTISIPTVNPDSSGVFAGYDIQTSIAAQKYNAELMAENGVISIGNIWEFLPYNDAKFAHFFTDQVFQNEVANLKEKLLRGAPDRERALDDLKNLYKMKFKGKVNKNLISLFLYGGSIQPKRTTFVRARWTVFGHDSLSSVYCHEREAYECAWNLLLTGDGYLDIEPRLDSLCSFLGSFRVDGVGVFQVMHHGAEDNWHSGVAARINPTLSVFSSDPKRYKHPHPAVVHDFWRYNPIQVDKTDSLFVEGEFN